AQLALVGVARHEDHPDAVLTLRRQLESQARSLGAEKFVRKLNQNSGPVAGQRIASTAAAMGQVVEDLQALVNDIVRALALDIDYEADAAGVMLMRRIVEAMWTWNSMVVMHRHALWQPAGPAWRSGGDDGAARCGAPAAA